MLKEFKLYNVKKLTSVQADMLYHYEAAEDLAALNELAKKDNDKEWLFVHQFAGFNCCHVWSIERGAVIYHGITHLDIIRLLSDKDMQERIVQYLPDYTMLGRINATWGSNPSNIRMEHVSEIFNYFR